MAKGWWAVVLSAVAGAAWAAPEGATAVHGQVQVGTRGTHTTVTTANGAGTSHSAVDWRSFSVGSHERVQVVQPSAASLSIHRVTGGQPSALLGRLESNGHLVLVNPAGIAVGPGAVVDTAGFTASTLGLSDADARTGRLRFAAGAQAPGGVLVHGRIVAREGDVALIAPQVAVGPDAVVRARDGAVILAAGRSVELTGRGLEGIRFLLTAPGDTAVNLGRLEGDAVGLFADRLVHSGLLRATGARRDAGKLVLYAASGALQRPGSVEDVEPAPGPGQSPLDEDGPAPVMQPLADTTPPPAAPASGPVPPAVPAGVLARATPVAADMLPAAATVAGTQVLAQAAAGLLTVQGGLAEWLAPVAGSAPERRRLRNALAAAPQCTP